ncbi:MAG: hypothetical protein DMG38_09030 [Acidobacteria bacterium]|nr:MAG: hypothetical protein DMG38_09030 [Acidobacteriota bacterium]
MRFPRTYVTIFLALLLGVSMRGQQAAASTTQSAPQALSLLQNSLSALTGGQSVTDVTLSGTSRRIAGSEDETGTVTFEALSAGAARFDFSYPSGLRSEIRAVSNTGPSGAWSGSDGTMHPISLHNVMNNAGIFPAFSLAGFASGQNIVVTFIGQETKNGHSVYHVSGSQQFPDSAPSAAALTQHLTQMEIFLDVSTLLPVAFDFSAHPDNDGALDIPAELLFSDYRTVSGIKIPFRVQKFLNNGLVLDLNFQNALVNSGLSGSSFNIQ